MKQTKTTKIALVSILAASSVVLGYFIKIPTPTGIFTLLDVGVFFTAFYFGSREGAIVGGLADVNVHPTKQEVRISKAISQVLKGNGNG